jgi:hypothetical protein
MSLKVGFTTDATVWIHISEVLQKVSCSRLVTHTIRSNAVWIAHIFT